MADCGESSSNLVNVRPVVVRVKRKSIQSPLEAFWLEINERPLKRPSLDFEKLSLSESSHGKETLKAKKVLVQHVETVGSSKATIDVLNSFLHDSADVSEFKTKVEERRLTFKQENKQDKMLSRAKDEHEVMARNARFEQIWNRRKGKKETVHDESLHEYCDLYDVVRIDDDEGSVKKVEEDLSPEDAEMLCNFLPLLREYIPSAAAEIQADVQSYLSGQDCLLTSSTDGYVYDLYTVQDTLSTADEDALTTYPLVQVDDDDDDFYDGPMESEWETDSNAEDNPMNDYPDEETSSDEDESTSSDKESDDEDGDEDETEGSGDDLKHENPINYIHSEDEYPIEDCDEDDEEMSGDDNWRWEYR